MNTATFMKGEIVNTVVCGYCQNNVETMRDRYWFHSRKSGVKYPLFLHGECGIKIFNQNENIWTFHNLGKQHSNKIITPTELKKEVEIDEVIYEQGKLNV